MISFGQIPKGLKASLFFAEVSINGNSVGSVDAITPKPFECKFLGDGVTQIFQIYKQTSSGQVEVGRTNLEPARPLNICMWNINTNKKMWNSNTSKKMWNHDTVTVNNKGQVILSSILEDGIEFSVTGTYY